MLRLGGKFKFVSGVVVGILIGSATVVFANQAINAILNEEIKISLNGVIQNFTDEATGEKQYPITYNNRTYLPLRNVAQLSGLTVYYDNDSNTAILVDSKEETTQLTNDKAKENTNTNKQTTTPKIPETRQETIARYIKAYNKLSPDYMISEIYWDYTQYIKFMKDGMFIDVYFNNNKIKAVVTENTYVDRDDGVRRDLSKRIPTHYRDVIYNLARVGNDDISERKIDKIYDDLESGKYGSSLINNSVDLDGVTISYYNQGDFFSTTIEMDFERQ